MSLPPALLLMGPTASGKTDVAVELVQRLPLEIISVDSAMVYKGMDIGTAKPSGAILERAPHRLIDILDPAETYSAARFREDALREMAAITARGRIPLLVGGTMLYFKALAEGLSRLPVADPVVRAELEAEAERLGWEHMHRQLARIDPESAARIHPNDPQRLQRALEVYRLSGKPLTQLLRDDTPQPPPWRLIQVALVPGERQVLRERIAIRFRQMLEQGFLNEVEGLFARPDLDADKPAIRCVGYRQAWEYLSGTVDYETMVARAITATRQLAKRQFTWLRQQDPERIFDPLDPQMSSNLLKFLEQTIINGS